MTTGRPFTVTLQTGVNNGGPSWPNRVGSGRLDNPTVDLWFNPAALVAPPPNTYGDSGRGILCGPGHTNFRYVTVEAVLRRRARECGIPVGRVQPFNHPGFGFPNAAIGNPTVPMSDPVSPWAAAMPGSRRHHAARRNNTRRIMGSLEGSILPDPVHRRCRSISTMSDCSCTCSTTISRPSGEMSKSRTMKSGPKFVN